MGIGQLGDQSMLPRFSRRLELLFRQQQRVSQMVATLRATQPF
jgi:hypothetical protein